MTWPAAPMPGLACTAVGNARVVHHARPPSPHALGLAHGVAPDPEATLVVLDLDGNGPPWSWAAVAHLLASRPGGPGPGFRLVFGTTAPPGLAVAAARELAARLGRPVATHDGPLVPVGSAGLFVPPGWGTGWVRVLPDGSVIPESHRYPRPAWDPLPLNTTARVGENGVVEPLPGGLWMRRVEVEPDERQRATLVTAMVPQHDVLTVVLGCAGTPPISLHDVGIVWRELPAETRKRVRFVEFGPVATPPGTAVGQAVADGIGEPATFYTGLPAVDPGGSGGSVPRAVHPDGRPGWHPYATELTFLPRAAGQGPKPPQLTAHRRPVPDVPEIAPGRYEIEPDVVLEVVWSGLWMRPPAEPSDAATVRATPLDPGRVAVMVDESSTGTAQRMRRLAASTVERLDPTVRGRAEIRTSGDVATAALPVIVAAAATPDTPLEAPPTGAAPAAAATPSASPPATRSAPERPAGLQLEAAEPELSTQLFPALTSEVMAAAAAPTPSPPEKPARPAALSPRPGPALAAAVSAPVVPAPPAIPAALPPAMPTPVAPVAPAPAGPAARPQPTPSPEACAVPPEGGLARERAWLRRTFGAEFDAASGSVAALLSQVPGLRAGAGTDDVTVDLVAVSLFLRTTGGALAEQVRSGEPGPHVPMARCVAAGLGRLPSHRGAVQIVVRGAARLARHYADHRDVVEWGLLAGTVAGGRAAPDDLEFRIWSSTARRTTMLDAVTPDRVVFLPGTTLRVLDVREGPAPVVLLRELSRAELADPGPTPFDEIARTGLDRAAAGWTTDEPPYGSAPGLLGTGEGNP